VGEAKIVISFKRVLTYKYLAGFIGGGRAAEDRPARRAGWLRKL